MDDNDADKIVERLKYSDEELLSVKLQKLIETQFDHVIAKWKTQTENTNGQTNS